MEIKKGTILNINSIHGKTTVKAISDFDTEKDEWWPCVLESKYLNGVSRDWIKGEEYYLRRGLTEIISLENV